LVLGALALILVLLALATWQWGRLPPPPRPAGASGGPAPDPRVSFPTPYRNVLPEVRYVGTSVCANCHARIAATFRRHPMGRSAASASELVGDFIGLLPSGCEPVPAAVVLASRLAQVERYDAVAHNPFTASGSEHRVVLRGGEVVHRETLRDPDGHTLVAFEAPVLFAIGSGSRGRTYVVARGDALFQSPISWYSQGNRWDLSPGYLGNDSHFERPVTASCLYCHVDSVDPVRGTVNRYRRPHPNPPPESGEGRVGGHAIGCERCHGPGELHVDSRERGEVPDGLDPTIVNPAHLEPYLREAVCEQCHLQGKTQILKAGRDLFDYRPGLPLHLFWSVFVAAPELTDNHKSVTTVEQMHTSKCFQKSGGAFGCISCHDPHELPAPEERASYYRDRCLRCHEPPSPLPLSPGGRGVGVRGAGASPRRHEPAARARAGAAPRAPACSEDERRRQQKEDSCIACHMRRLTSSDIAHTANTDHRLLRRPDEAEQPHGPRGLEPGALPMVHFHQDLVAPDDQGAARDRGIALAQYAVDLHDREAAQQALDLLDAALREWPDDVAAQEARANALAAAGDMDAGVVAYDAVVAKAPNDENFILQAAALAEQTGRPEKAAEYYRRALVLNPDRAQTYVGLARTDMARRDWAHAILELEAGLRLNPFEVEARTLLLSCCLQTGDRPRAREEYRRLLYMDAPDRPGLLNWLERQRRVAPDLGR
jgi:Tfp pilus assembly protein PilF